VDHDLAGHTVVGNHKGQFSGFNIVDPRPGTVHQFGTRRDILSARQRGWWIADPEVDGRPAHEIMTDYVSQSGTPVDQSGGLYPEYIHLVTSEENYRRLREEHERASREQIAPAGLGFLDGVSEEEFASARGADGRRIPSRFATKDHGTYTMEGDRVLEHMTPRGILREEDI
jgi:hypothetical protein